MKPEYRLRYKLRSRTATFARLVSDAQWCIKRLLDRAVRPYASFSGGKDSTCLLLLLADIGRTDIPVFTQADDLDWPDKREHCHRLVVQLGFGDYEYRTSEVSAAEQFSDSGLGTEIRGTFSHVIERYAEERERDGAIIGIRAEESSDRGKLARYRGRLFQASDGEWRCMPLMDWSGEDVFALIISRDAPYMRLYDCDQHRAPHEWRMSWPANPAFWRSGSAAELRHHFPEYFARLAQLNPNLRAFA